MCFAVVTDSIAVVGGKYDIAGRTQTLPSESAIAWRTREAVGKNDDRLFDRLTRFGDHTIDIQAAELD